MLSEPFLGSAAVAAGHLSRADLRSGLYDQVFRDVYVRADVEQDLRLLSTAAHLLVPDDGALCGHSAAIVLGADCARRGVPAELIAPMGDVRKRRGLVVRQAVLGPGDVEIRDGLRVTTARRTAWDLGRRLPLVEAVVAVDALARVGDFAPATLLQGPPGARGCRHLAKAVDLADPRAGSPMETRMRLLLVFAGLPAPELQYELRDAYGLVVARFDLAYPEARLALEFDGEVHFDREHAIADRNRDLRTGDHGWLTMRFTAADVHVTKEATARRVGRLRAERLARPHVVENDVVVINRAI